MKKIIMLLLSAILIGTPVVRATADSDLKAGIEKYEAKEYTSAIEFFDSAIKHNSKLTDAYYYRAMTKMDSQDYENAVKDFTHVISLEPKNARGYMGRGAAYASNKQYDKSLPDMNKAIQLDPKDWEKYVGRAMVQYELKDKTAAYADLKKAETVEGARLSSVYGIKAIFEVGDLKFKDAYGDYRKSKKYSKAEEKAKK